MNNETSPTHSLSNQELLPLYSPSLRQQLTAIMLFLMILGVFRMEVLIRFNTHFLGGYEGDAGLYIWLIKTNLHNLLSEPWFNTKAFYPYTRTLAWSDNYILPSLAVWPFLKLGLSLEASYNSILILANFLNGFITYRLAFVLIGVQLPALFSGMLFMCFSYLGLQLGHPQLQYAFWIPAAIYYLFKYIYRPGWMPALFIGLMTFLCFLCSVYYAVFIALAVPTLLLALLILKPQALTLKSWVRLVAGGLAGLSPLVFFLKPYLDVRNAFGSRTFLEARSFAATAASFFSAPSYNLLYNKSSLWSHAEANLFPGLAVLILTAFACKHMVDTKRLRWRTLSFFFFLIAAGIFSLPWLSHPYCKYVTAACLWGALLSFGLVLFKLGKLETKLGFSIITNRNLIALFLFLSLVTFSISLGPLNNVASGRVSLTPFAFFYYILPGLNSIRAISRIGVLTIFGLVMASAFALQLLMQRRNFCAWFSGLVLFFGLLENYNYIYPVQPADKPPEAFNTLASKSFQNSFNVKKDDALIVLPFTSNLNPDLSVKSWSNFSILNVHYMNWSSDGGLSLVNGYSGQRTWFTDNLPGRLAEFPDALSLKALAGISNLRYILFIPRFAPAEVSKTVLARSQNFSSELIHVLTDDQGAMLFEYAPTTKISSDFKVFVPSFPEGFLHLELMALYQEGSPSLEVPVLISYRPKKEVSTTLALPANGEFNTYSVRTPSDTDRCRPLTVSFKVPTTATVYLRTRRFEALP
ncbi:MAG: hypothetical protein GX589_09355 [Deltaproteobacteria bacterium]|nr:hypothetical protein [Deltaproteobacteria bacterium]